MNRPRASLLLVTLVATLFLMTGTAAAQEPTITLDRSEDLADGDTLTATVSGFPADDASFISGQCVLPITDPLQQCNVGNIVPVPLDANGEATFQITVSVGPIGTGNCGFGADDCIVLVGSLADPTINALAPITFAEEDLAFTGPGHLLTLSLLASGFLVVGFLMVLRSRRLESRIV